MQNLLFPFRSSVLVGLVLVGFLCGAEPIDPKKNPPPPLLPGEEEPLPITPKKVVIPEAPKVDPKLLEALPAPKQVLPKEEIKPVRHDAPEAKSFEQVWIVRREGAIASDTIRLGLFNHSEREIFLEIERVPVKLPSRHYLLLQRPREFSWREKDGNLQKVTVPSDADGVEMIFKK